MPNLLKSLRFVFIISLLGCVVGILGMLLSFVLFEVQHLAFGYSIEHIHAHESYLQGVRASSALRRVIVLFICGVLGGVGWYLLYRYGRKLVNINDVVDAKKPVMPVAETIINALLQIITIGLGSPLGKEGAPREIGALTANLFGTYFRVNDQDMRLLIAAGAGAGLAAVYNVPLGGALFALEVLLQGAKPRWIFVVFSVSGIAALSAQLGLGNVHQYLIFPPLSFTCDLLIWALLTGPIFAFAAQFFVVITSQAKNKAPRHAQVIIYNIANFTLLGVLLIFLPELAGNGKSAAEISFTGQITLQYAAILIVAKIFVEWASLRAGAHGGLLTPSFANGALLAIILGSIWCYFFSGTSLGAFAIVGAATFLAIANKMPMTAIVITLEMTQVDLQLTVPMVVCVTAAWLTKRYLIPRRLRL